MTTRLVVVDAFTDRPFAGNPAAVCVLERPGPDAWMQAVAAEMNLSETAFCVPRPDDGQFDLRWFTPTTEVDLCGHATLATTHVLGADARYHTRSGVLAGAVGDDGWIVLDFPLDPTTEVDPPDGWAAVVGEAPVVAVATGREDWLVELASDAAVRDLRSDFAALVALGRRGLIATAAGAGGGADVVSRCFYPSFGIPEDPVTGSAHCTIAAYWAGRLGPELVCEQASARGGIVRTRVQGDRVELRGRAVTVSEVTLLVDP